MKRKLRIIRIKIKNWFKVLFRELWFYACWPYYKLRAKYYSMVLKDLVELAKGYGETFQVEMYTERGKEFLTPFVHIVKSNYFKRKYFQEIGRLMYATEKGVNPNVKSKYIFVTSQQMAMITNDHKIKTKYTLVVV